jgi:predicted aldo/keto reductase-like oxidoreductase
LKSELTTDKIFVSVYAALRTYKVMQELKKEGIARFIGFSSMSSAVRSKEMLENLDVDVAILAFNPTQYGKYAELALPPARKQNTGVIAMKLMRGLVGEEATPEELFNYALSLDGVSSAVIGHVGLKQLKANIKIARKTEVANSARIDHRELEDRLAKFAGPHKLCWARPGYTDGIVLA